MSNPIGNSPTHSLYPFTDEDRRLISDLVDIQKQPSPVRTDEERLKLLFGANERRPTLTGEWVERYGRETRVMLVEHLSHKFPTSRRVKVIEDHVQTFLVRLIEKDTLAPKIRQFRQEVYSEALRKGIHIHDARIFEQIDQFNPINPSVLRVWCYQSTCTEIRGWGVDASLRKSRGAKTNRDRMADQGKLPTIIVQSAEAAVERRYEVENGEVISDIHNPHDLTVEEGMIATERRALIQSVIMAEMGDTQLSKSLFSILLETGDRREIAAELGFSRAKTAALLSRLRSALEDEGIFASD